jgi:YjjG family noncanonical pyrimidine nucleotidase
MNLKAVLFDLDDTLFDHAHASGVALKALHDRHAGADVVFDDFSAKHGELLEVFHQRFLAGELSLDEARAQRMMALFASFGELLDDEVAWQIAGEYRELHQSNRQLVEGARELLDDLSREFALAVVTNNSSAEQYAKLAHLGIANHFKAVVISEEIGVTKPDAAIYFAALDRLGCEPHEAVMIGDNLHADVLGAQDAGIAAVWFNRFDRVGPSAHTQHLEQIRALGPVAQVRQALERAHQNRIRLFQGVKHVLSALAS